MRLAIPHQVGRGSSNILKTTIGDTLSEVNIVVANTPSDSLEAISSAEIVIAMQINERQQAHAEALQWLQTPSSGVDHLDLDWYEEREIIVTNAAGLSAQPMAEQVLAYMLAFERNLLQGFRRQQQGFFKPYSVGETIRGKTVGIIGVGKNGSRIADLAKALGMTVIGTKRNTTNAPDTVDEIFGPDELHEVLSRSDFVVISCSLTDKTRGLVGAKEFEVMKETGIVINIARPAIVVEDDLVNALQTNVIAGAALDQLSRDSWTGSLVWDLPNVIITPGTGGQQGPHPQQEPFYEDLAEFFVENYEHYTNNEVDSMKNRVL